MAQPYPLPVRGKTKRRRWWRRFVLSVAGVLLLGVLIWWVIDRHNNCDGLNGTSGPGYNLFRAADGHQCIGWTVEQNYAFGSTDPAVGSVISNIVAENQRVASIPQGRYVRVAVMMPMTATADSAMRPGLIRNSLEGAYAAQRYANEKPASSLGDKNMQIQLVLANNGSYQNLWPKVVVELGRLRDGEHPLVAVTGLGVSVQDTRAAAAELNKAWNLPSIGSVMTADDMTTRGMPGEPTRPALFKVSASNHQYALALKQALNAQQAMKKGFLVWDRNDDNFVQSLSAAFKQTFDDTFHLSQHGSAFSGSKPPVTGTPALFREIARDISIEKPDIVFYAGRDRDLPLLVRTLKNRPHEGPLSPIVIAVGTTGLLVSDDQREGTESEPLTKGDLTAANIGILEASTTNPAGWAEHEPGTPPHYDEFHKFFVGQGPSELGYSEGDLADGYAIMHYDAVAVAVRAARDIFAQKASNNAAGTSPLPSSADVRNAIGSSRNNRFPGASGDFYFEEQQPPNDLWPIEKPVPIIRFGAIVSTPSWKQPSSYKTECQVLAHPETPGNFQTRSCTS